MLAWAIAYLCYSLTLLAMYALLLKPPKGTKSFFRMTDLKLYDKKEKPVSVLPEHLSLLSEFGKSCILKFFLTEGEKIIMMFTSIFTSE